MDSANSGRHRRTLGGGDRDSSAVSSAATASAGARRLDWLSCQQPHHEGVKLGRDVGPERRRTDGVGVHDRVRDRDLVLAFERTAPRQHLVEQHTEGPEVGATVELARREPAQAPCRTPCPVCRVTWSASRRPPWRHRNRGSSLRRRRGASRSPASDRGERSRRDGRRAVRVRSVLQWRAHRRSAAGPSAQCAP